jgi:hypothetical protein
MPFLAMDVGECKTFCNKSKCFQRKYNALSGRMGSGD